MLKWNFGSISNSATKETKNLVVTALTKENARDILIGGAIVMGGFAYTAISLFRNGADAFGRAETKTLFDLGLVEPLGDAAEKIADADYNLKV